MPNRISTRLKVEVAILAALGVLVVDPLRWLDGDLEPPDSVLEAARSLDGRWLLTKDALTSDEPKVALTIVARSPQVVGTRGVVRSAAACVVTLRDELFERYPCGRSWTVPLEVSVDSITSPIAATLTVRPDSTIRLELGLGKLLVEETLRRGERRYFGRDPISGRYWELERLEIP